MSTPFSLLCLIILTGFHRNASFRRNMLNYLNTTSTFCKQTKDNLINRKFQYRPRPSGVARGGGRGQHFNGGGTSLTKFNLERSLKVLVFSYYFKYIFKCSTAFQFSHLEALDW